MKLTRTRYSEPPIFSAPSVLLGSVRAMPNEPMSIRGGDPWKEQDYERFVEELRNGRPIEDIAGVLQRTVKSVRGRLPRLVPLELQATLKPSERELWVREALNTDETYDWLATLRENYRVRREHFWSIADTTLLREKWEAREPLPKIAEEFGISEVMTAQHLCRHGLARSMQEVVDRLGVTPGGTIDIRTRMALDRAASSVWVLITDGIGTRVPELNRQRQHVSMHVSLEDAEDRLDELLREAEAHSYGPVKWSVVCRSLGDDTTGQERHGITDDVAS